MLEFSELGTVIHTDDAYQVCFNLARQLEEQPANSSLLHQLARMIRTVTDQPVDEYVKILIENNNFIKSDLFSYYEHLYIADEAMLVSKLMSTASGRLAVAQNVEKLRSVSIQAIVDLSQVASDYQALSALCSREVNINHQTVVSELLAQGDYRTIARDIDSYFLIDFSQIYTSFFSKDNTMPANEKWVFKFFLNANMQLWQDAVSEADIETLSEQSNFFYNADKWSDRVATSPRTKQIFLEYEETLQEKILLETCDSYNFIGLKRLLCLGNASVISQFSKKIDEMKLQHSHFIAAGNHQLAQDLAEVIELLESDVTAPNVTLFYRKKDIRNEASEKRDRLPICDIRKLAINFYINAYFENEASEILGLQLEPRDSEGGLHANEREFSKLLDRAALAQLLSQAKKSVESVFHYVRKFVFIQVQYESSSTTGYKVPINARSEVSFSVDQIIDYLTRIKQLFSLMRGASSIGGDTWATIADLGLESWRVESVNADSRRDVSNMIGLTDRIFQMHHNTGSIFNKNPRVHYHDLLQEVFDFFAQKHDFVEMLAFAEAQGCFTGSELVEMKRRQTVLEGLQNAPVRTKTD